MSSNVDFKYLNAELYRHPGEREARERLEKIPGFRKALDMLSEGSGAQAHRQAEISSMVRVGPGVYPVLSDLWNGVQGLFGLHGTPLHIAWDAPQPCSLRGGSQSSSVVLDTRMLDLPESEMTALLAMQAGTIRLGNASMMAAADFSRWFMDFYGIWGAPAALPAWGFENWRRYALFSADRAASLAQGDPESVLALLNRTAGAGEKGWGGITRPDDLRVQGLEAISHQADWSNSRVRRFALAMNRHNEVGLIRRVDLLDWFAGGTPARILSGQTTEPEEVAGKDPSLAYWGEFAGSQEGTGGSDPLAAVSDLKDMAERGINSFMKAGEAFWTTLMENNKKQ